MFNRFAANVSYPDMLLRLDAQKRRAKNGSPLLSAE
jgi:hypothetical protein